MTKRRQRFFAFDDGRACHRARDVAGEHRGAADPSGRDVRRAGNRVDEDALRARPDAARRTAGESGSPARPLSREPAADAAAGRALPTEPGPVAAARASNALSTSGTSSARFGNRSHVAHRRQEGSPDADPALTDFTRQERDDDRQVVGRRSLQQRRQPGDFVEPPRRSAPPRRTCRRPRTDAFADRIENGCTCGRRGCASVMMSAVTLDVPVRTRSSPFAGIAVVAVHIVLVIRSGVVELAQMAGPA